MINARMMKFAIAALTIGIVAVGLCRAAIAASFNAPLVECTLVTLPDSLVGCGSDPLAKGDASIEETGEVEIVVEGGGASTSYAAVFRTPDGSSSIPLGTLNTDSKGNGTLHKKSVLTLGKISAGSVVLTRTGSDQYVSGPSINGGPNFRPSLVRCTEVNDPATLSGCGSDTLKDGSVDIESDDGSLDIRLHGASANVTYAAVLRAPDGTEFSLPNVNTDGKGKGKLISSALFAGSTIGSGTVVLKRAGFDQFLSGFDVTQKPKPKVVSKTNLVRCIDVTLPLLSNCGTDSLDSGSAQVDQNGKLQVKLNGAAALTKYSVSFRPLDNSGDIDTTLSLTTDKNGDAHSSVAYPASGTVASGNFVVKGAGFDQFVTGFAVK
jgi:hypothetical protein